MRTCSRVIPNPGLRRRCSNGSHLTRQFVVITVGMTCEVCNRREGVGVASVPGVPYSAAYCSECLAADAHPLWIVVVNTALCGGLDHCAPWWQDLVAKTLAHLQVSDEDFKSQVDKDLAELAAME